MICQRNYLLDTETMSIHVIYTTILLGKSYCNIQVKLLAIYSYFQDTSKNNFDIVLQQHKRGVKNNSKINYV